MLRANKLGPTSSKLSWAHNRNPFPLVRNDHFVRKGSNFRKRKGYFSSVFVRRPFRAKGSPPKFENRNFTSIFDLRRPFRAKGFRLAPQNRNFTSIFDLRRPFRAKGLRLAPQNRNFQLVFQRVFSPKQGVFLTPKTFKFDTQIPSNRHHFLRIWNQSGTSREPVGNQSGKSVHHSERAKNRPKNAKNPAKTSFFEHF